MTAGRAVRNHRSDRTSDSYAGIPAHAAAGLHDEIFKKVTEFFNPERGPVLDLAAGSGAITQRLIDGCYEVHPVELDPESWRVESVMPTIADLNRPGWVKTLKNTNYSQVIAVEIIEHLENPRQFLRGIFEILLPGGLAIVTTPNPISAMSVALSILDSRYYVFDRSLYYEIGHVSVMPPWMLACHAEDAGFKVITLETVCDPVFDTRWKAIVHSCFARLLSLVRRQIGFDRQVSLIVLEKGSV